MDTVISKDAIPMRVTGTHMNYFFICHRKLWLFSHSIKMEQNSELVDAGRLIHETSHRERSEQYSEIQIGPIKIDFFDQKNKIIYEMKKSSKLEKAHVWQLKYYIYVFKCAGIEGVRGVLEYPKLRKREEVDLSAADEGELEYAIAGIERIISSGECPERLNKKFCKKCSYFDLCWSGEAP